eukprot:6193873-Pleurochrysis_carterae.AAC.4
MRSLPSEQRHIDAVHSNKCHALVDHRDKCCTWLAAPSPATATAAAVSAAAAAAAALDGPSYSAISTRGNDMNLAVQCFCFILHPNLPHSFMMPLRTLTRRTAARPDLDKHILYMILDRCKGKCDLQQDRELCCARRHEAHNHSLLRLAAPLEPDNERQARGLRARHRRHRAQRVRRRLRFPFAFVSHCSSILRDGLVAGPAGDAYICLKPDCWRSRAVENALNVADMLMRVSFHQYSCYRQPAPFGRPHTPDVEDGLHLVCSPLTCCPGQFSGLRSRVCFRMLKYRCIAWLGPISERRRTYPKTRVYLRAVLATCCSIRACSGTLQISLLSAAT